MSIARFVLCRADMGLEHQVELPRLSQILAAAIRTLLHALLLDNLIGAQSRLASPAIDHRIAESLFVTARFPDRAVHQDRAVHADDIVALMHHDAPPVIFQVAL